MARGRETEVEVKFRRDLKLLDVVMIGLGPTIGTTIFLLVGPGYAITGPSLILAFGLSFVITLFTAMAYMELGSAFPETGGGYMWVRHAMKDPWGFLGGWLSWFGHCIVGAFYIIGFGLGAVALLEVLTGSQDVVLLGLNEAQLTRLFAILALVVFLGLNYRGTKITGKSETAVTVTLVAIVLAFIVLGFVFFLRQSPLPMSNFTPFFQGNTPWIQFLALFGAMGFTFIIFEGYEIIAQTGEEAREPEKNIPRAHFLVIGFSTAIFILVAFVAIGIAGNCVTPPTQGCLLIEVPGGGIVGNPNAIGDIAAVIGPFGLGAYLIIVGIVLGALAATNSLIFSSSRVAFAMGRDGTLPRSLGRLHPRRRTPHVAVLASGFIIILLTLTLDINTVAASAGIMFLLLFVMVNYSALVLRRTMPHVKRYYKMPAFPLPPLIGIVGSLVIAMSLWVIDWVAWVIALGWLGLGLLIHYLYRRKEVVAGVSRIVETILPATRERYQILLPIEDFERTELVDLAALVAKVEDAELTLLHIIEVPATLPIDAIDRFYVAEVRRNLAKLRRRAEDLGVSAKARVEVSHKIFETVLENIREDETDLLVLGWKGGWRKGRILGQNVDRFVQEAPCDVLVFKGIGMKEKLERILVMNAPEWHVSYATGYAILLAKRDHAKVTIFTAVQTEKELEKGRTYSARLAEMCRTHGVLFEEKDAKVRSIVDAVVAEATGYDLLALGASSEWRLTQFAFGAMQDQIARRAQPPTLMVRKVRRPDQIPTSAT